MAQAAEVEDQLVENVQDLNLNNATVIAGGEFHVHIYNDGKAVDDDDVNVLDETLRANQKKVANVKVKSHETSLVKLLVIHRKDVDVKGLQELLFHSFNEKNVTFLEVNELQSAAKENAIKEAESKFSNQAAKDNYIAKHGNYIIITGGAGYGKTTLGLQILQHVFDTQSESGYIFHLNLPSLDNSKELCAFAFLIKVSNPNWQYHLERDNKILEKISQSKNLCIIFDSLDETDFNLLKKAPVIGLYDRAKPEVIFQNLLRGDILPNASKYLITRPEAYLQLHPDCKSHFPLEVLGLDENSQDMLFKEICQSQEKYEKVKQALKQNPAASVLSCIPLFAKAIPKYVLSHGLADGAFTTTDVFTSFLNDYIRSAHFKNHPSVLRKISELALCGMLNNRSTFEMEDLANVGLETDGLEDFLNVQVHSSDITLKILDGDKLVLFNHRLFQEFFTALKLMLDTPMERFSELLENFKSKQWEMVLQFMFGLLNPELHRKLKAFFPISSADVSTKRGLLKDLVVSMAKDFAQTSVKDFPISLASLSDFDAETHAKWQEFRVRPDDKRLFKLCSLAYESTDSEITRSVVEVLPDMVLLSRTILPSHVASLCHVLRATDKPITINVGAIGELAKFIGGGLKMLIETIAETPHTIRKFHVDETTISIATLAQLIPQIEELAIRDNNLSIEDSKLICESLQKKTKPIELLDLSLNDLDEAGVKLLSGCIPYIERLVIVRCGLTSEHLLVLASSIEQRQHPMESLDLRENKIGSRGASCLATIVHKVNQLWLRDCEIEEVAALTEAIARREHPMDLLDLRGNKIGSRGSGSLSTVVHKVNQLWLRDCGIKHVGGLTEAITRREHPMKYLDISNNLIGDRGVSALERCRGKIERLISDNCDSTSEAKQVNTKAHTEWASPSFPTAEDFRRQNQNRNRPIEKRSKCHVM